MNTVVAADFRVVIDTNTLLRGIIGKTSAAARVLRAADERSIVVLLSKALADEYRFVLGDPEVTSRYPEIDFELVERTIARMRYLGEYFPRVRSTFPFQRDPNDAKLVELALTGHADFILTSDKDLLSLAWEHNSAARRFRQRLPRTRVMEAGEFVRLFGTALGV